jgi:predicted acyl esterase
VTSATKSFEGIVVRDVTIPMPDGIELAARVYLPAEEGQFPVLYAASPYQYDTDHLPNSALFPWYEVGPFEWYVREQGYAFFHLDVRGSGHSGGEWDPMGPIERDDHREVLDWIAAADWCNGKIGGYGQSYYCMAQWQAAISGTDKLTCLGAFDGVIDTYRAFTHHGGIPHGFANFWVNLVAMSHVTRMDPSDSPRQIRNPIPDYVMHSSDDDFWRARSAMWGLEDVDIPLYSIGVWGKRDLHLQGNLDGYNLVDSDKKLLVINPENVVQAHHIFTTEEFHQEIMLPFYDHYLKGTANNWQEDTPAVKYWVYGRDTWREDSTWPPSAVARETILHLNKGPSGSINSLNDGCLSSEPIGEDAKTEFSYPDLRWHIGNVAFGKYGPDAQRFNLTFTSDPLEEDLEVVGNPVLELYLSSTEIDTDVIVKLQEQLPLDEKLLADGRQPDSKLVAKGWLKASHREIDEEWSRKLGRPFHPHRDPEPLKPGEVYKMEICLTACGYMFNKGNRIRLDISNTDSGLTDAQFASVYHWEKVGTDTYYHSPDHLSRLVLPTA